MSRVECRLTRADGTVTVSVSSTSLSTTRIACLSTGHHVIETAGSRPPRGRLFPGSAESERDTTTGEPDNKPSEKIVRLVPQLPGE